MSKPVGYIVRPRDMKSLLRELNRANAVQPGNLYDAARTLVGFAEPIDSLPLDEPVNVPADALDRIADLWTSAAGDASVLHAIAAVLLETGRL